MPQEFNLSNIASLIGSVLSLITAIVLWWYGRAHHTAPRLLSLYFLVIAYGLLIVFLLYSTMMQYPPWYHLYRTGNIAGLLFMPISFLYFQSVLLQRKFKSIDLLHFLP